MNYGKKDFMGGNIMKTRKWIFYCILMLVLLLPGCASKEKSYDTPEELIQDYLKAVQNEDYEKIWSLIPKQIQEYAIDQEIISNKEDGLEYIEYAVNDYHWLVEVDLPEQNKFTFEITKSGEEDAKRVQNYLKHEGIKIVVKEAAYDVVLIKLDNGDEIEAAFFMIKTNDSWYLTSVVGDDEIFEY